MKKILETLKKFLGIGVQYGTLVNQAVQAVQAETAGSNVPGATKKQIAITYVLAAAHAGENIPVDAVQTVSALIDTAVTVLTVLVPSFAAQANTPQVPPA